MRSRPRPVSMLRAASGVRLPSAALLLSINTWRSHML